MTKLVSEKDMADFKKIVIYLTDEERGLIDELKNKFEVRTNAEVFRKCAQDLRVACKEDPEAGSRVMRRSLMTLGEESRAANPFANGRTTSVQISEPSIEFLDAFCKTVNLERTELLRALLRASLTGKL